jgi:hypothetical protein
VADPTSLNNIKGSSNPCLITKENCDQFIIVNNGVLKVPEIWDKLKACLNPEMYNGIIMLKKVHPKNRLTKIDMFNTTIAAGLKRTIKSMIKERTQKFVRATKTYIQASSGTHGQ